MSEGNDHPIASSGFEGIHRIISLYIPDNFEYLIADSEMLHQLIFQIYQMTSVTSIDGVKVRHLDGEKNETKWSRLSSTGIKSLCDFKGRIKYSYSEEDLSFHEDEMEELENQGYIPFVDLTPYFNAISSGKPEDIVFQSTKDIILVDKRGKSDDPRGFSNVDMKYYTPRLNLGKIFTLKEFIDGLHLIKSHIADRNYENYSSVSILESPYSYTLYIWFSHDS